MWQTVSPPLPHLQNSSKGFRPKGLPQGVHRWHLWPVRILHLFLAILEEVIGIRQHQRCLIRRSDGEGI